MSMELKKYNTDGFYVAKGLLKKSDINSVNGSLLRSVAAQLSLLGAPTCASDLFSSAQQSATGACPQRSRACRTSMRRLRHSVLDRPLEIHSAN